MSTITIAGATGYLGRHLVAEFHRRGHTTTVIVRDAERARSAGPWGAPPLDGLVDHWIVGDVTDPRTTAGAASGSDHVVSALGVTRQNTDPWMIDNLANKAILASALRHGVNSFTYVNALGAEHCPTRLTRAKTAFARALAGSRITAQIINPPAYFSDMMALLSMARHGVVAVMRREARINPVHGADLARYIADRVESGDAGQWDVGGPDTLTWEQWARTAFHVLGRRARIVTAPQLLVGPAIRATAMASPRKGDTARFAVWNMLHDCVAPATGTHRLADFYAEHARGPR